MRDRVAKDYYKILGVSKDSSNDAIKKAYRKLAMQYHPDRNPGKEEWANEKFKEINEAYGILGNAKKRKQYDQFGVAGDVGDIFGSNSTRTAFEDILRDFGGAGLGYSFLDDIFGEALKGRGTSFSFKNFGGQKGGVRFETRPGGGINLNEIFAQAQKGQRRRSVSYELAITKEEASKGAKKVLTRKRKRLEVKVPPGVKTGSLVKLSNARQITDGVLGDILIRIKVK